MEWKSRRPLIRSSTRAYCLPSTSRDHLLAAYIIIKSGSLRVNALASNQTWLASFRSTALDSERGMQCRESETRHHNLAKKVR
jgi:hypothetical protein